MPERFRGGCPFGAPRWLHGTTPGLEVLGYADPDSDEPSTVDSAASVPRSLAADEESQWTDEDRPRYPYQDTVIYEMHVKGFTMRHRAGDRITVRPRSLSVLRSNQPTS